MYSTNQPTALPPDIPAATRTLVTWADAVDATAAALSACPDLRRIYLLQTGKPGDAQARRAPKPEDPRVRVLTLDPHRPLRAQLSAAWSLNDEPLYFAEGRVALHLPATTTNLPAVSAVTSACLEYLRGFFSDLAFCSVRGWHLLENIFLNLPHLAHARPLAEICGRASGRQVMIVGAGPALDRNLDLIRRVRAGVVLVACDAALTPLEHGGIRPDLAVSTDAGDLAWRFFAPLTAEMRRIPLIALLHGSRPVVHYHSGPLYLCRGPWTGYAALEKQIGHPLDPIDSGLCVGHAAFEIARLLDAKRIIMVGFNLAFEQDRFHPRHMAAPVFHEHPPPAANLTQVPGVDGRPVTTELSMLMYLREFERRIAHAGREVWDATGSGAMKKGARIVNETQVMDACRSDAPGFTLPPETAVTGKAVRTRYWHNAAAAMLRDLPSTDAIPATQPSELADRCVPDALTGRHPDMMLVMSGALNPGLGARLHFAARDWRQTPADNGRAAELRAAAAAYLDDVRRVAGLTHETTAIAAGDTLDDRHALALTPDLAILPAWDAWHAALNAAGFVLHAYRDDPHDFPSVWRTCRRVRNRIVLTFEDTVMPAAWHLPGRICLNLRVNPPATDTDFNPAENWMPGYAVICACPDTAQAWRARMPADRPVYLWTPGKPPVAAGGGQPLTWPAIAARLTSQVVQGRRAESHK